MPPSEPRHVSGFVSLVGRPNTGKSTMLNALVGTRLAIVSAKPQTTRTSIQGVLTRDDAQIVFLDTPGMHRPRTPLNERMMESVREALAGRDLLVLVADAAAPYRDEDAEAVEMLKTAGAPVLLALNKIDRLRDKSPLLPLIDRYRAMHEFAGCLPVSARTGEGLDGLTAAIVARLPEGPRYFPPDHVTDQPERFLAGEIVREKILAATQQEVPHAVAVIVEKWEESGRLLRISAAIVVEKPGQKAIVIGAKGAVLKHIGIEARRELEALLGRKIHLELFVKVRADWRRSRAFLRELDWKSMAGVD